ncbi:MAG: radical SAM protein [Phycisphaerae bacterium]|nr:radical SAM protein [Phycisphaerae bacterium]NIP53332.1 radical SAM protein [Phycisphaerae bacterium]NIS49967.1 radical SAM protein [Phycisphaerae bacterium]NIU07671.1 radical SAM protein [Phycisphaerae bacterium]NIU57536.1 radical SAM protein [Phycisphaerae bacterium]
MLSDRFNRRIDYLRISVTDRCNHSCVYCMPGIPFMHKSHEDILSYEQIESVAKVAAKMGIRKIRLTGGEPLVRKDIEQLVAKLAAIEGIDEVCMTTNGSLLAEMAMKLKRSGLGRVNISIDSLDEDRFGRISRGGDLQQTLAGIDAAQKAGLIPIKINMVILDDTTKDEIETMRTFCKQKGLKLQNIMQFSLYDRADLSSRFKTQRPPKCMECNRLRLTADGFLKPCLFSDNEVRVNFDNIAESILEAVARKPENGSSCRNRPMNQIGG